MSDGNNYPGNYSGDPTVSYSENLRRAEDQQRREQAVRDRQREESERAERCNREERERQEQWQRDIDREYRERQNQWQISSDGNNQVITTHVRSNSQDKGSATNSVVAKANVAQLRNRSPYRYNNPWRNVLMGMVFGALLGAVLTFAFLISNFSWFDGYVKRHYYYNWRQAK